MSNSSPPTLLDRLTRFSPAEGEQAGQDRRRRLRQEPPPVLNERINEGDGRVHTRFMAGDEAESYRASEFAMTSMDVPDRLDLREVRYRAEEDYKRPGLLSFDRYLLGLWTRRIVLLTLLSLLAIWGYGQFGVIKEALSPQHIAGRLSAGSGLAVQIADVSYRITPRPQILLEGVVVANELAIDQVALELNWRDLWSSVIGQGANWGIATVSGLRVSGEQQAWGLLSQIMALGEAVPREVAAVRFESVQLDGEALVAGEYAFLLQRNRGGVFDSLQITPKGSEAGFRLSLKRAPWPNWDQPDGAQALAPELRLPRFAFQFAANDWTLPWGPGGQWTEVVAEGYLSPKLLEIENYALSGRYGVVRGALYAATDLYWVLTGYANGTGIDVESLVAATGGDAANQPAFSEKDRKPIAFSGMAKFQLAAEGRGQSLQEVLQQSVASGPVQVRWAMIRGVNLGYVATHAGAARGLSGGLTRFSDFDATLLLRPGGFTLSDIVARAGALATRGQVKMDKETQALGGVISVSLGATRVQAPVTLRVGGQPLAPEFGR